MAHAARAQRACGDAHTPEPAHAPEDRSRRADGFLPTTAHFMAFFGAGAAAFAFRMAFVATNACSFAALLTTFMAFIAARIAFVVTNACSFAAFRTAFMAFIAFAARIALAMIRREVSRTPPKRLKRTRGAL